MNKLSKRLQTALDWVTGDILLDVGSDHALLCVGAILQGVVKQAIASDNKEGPYQKAQVTIAQAGLKQQITCCLANGLEGITKEIDTCTMLGMGGLLIKELLLAKEVRYVKQFILGPQSEQTELRTFLMNHQFQIVDETTIEERGKFYSLMKVIHGEMSYTPIQCAYGYINIQKQEPSWQAMIRKKINLYVEAYGKTKDIQKQAQIQSKLTELRSVLHERH